jgi:alginate O-acetyltransferase complex protein AlgJ
VHEGDTTAMLDLSRRLSPPQADTMPLRIVLGPDGDPWRPTRGADVLVLGDSFSNIYSLPTMGWGEAAGFVEHLSLALGRPVDRVVQNDNGASATRLALAREPDRLAATRVVVWQFAARELASGAWVPVSLPPR